MKRSHLLEPYEVCGFPQVEAFQLWSILGLQYLLMSTKSPRITTTKEHLAPELLCNEMDEFLEPRSCVSETFLLSPRSISLHNV